MSDQRQAICARFFPEMQAGGYTRVDGSIEFYSRVNALCSRDSVVLDYGAGRGRFLEDPVAYRRDLRLLRGKVARVIGVDVDPVVRRNPAVDAAYCLGSDGCIPLNDSTVDLIVSDFTFEHIEWPRIVAKELTRVLKPGGWIAVRTPNKYGYIALGARLVPNELHNRVLAFLQPDKKTIDTFPTRYRLNTRAALRRHFPGFENFIYYHDAEPGYAAESVLLWRLSVGLRGICPAGLRTMLFAFLRKPTS